MTVDANLLIYASDQESPFHVAAQRWLGELLSTEQVGLPIQSLLAFVRIVTNTHLRTRAIDVKTAIDVVAEWLREPEVFILNPGSRHWDIYRELYLASNGTGHLSTDVHIAALAIENEAILYTTDRDFARFPALRWINPLAPRSS